MKRTTLNKLQAEALAVFNAAGYQCADDIPDSLLGAYPVQNRAYVKAIVWEGVSPDDAKRAMRDCCLTDGAVIAKVKWAIKRVREHGANIPALEARLKDLEAQYAAASLELLKARAKLDPDS
jgi:hypothetical protein